MKTYCVEYKMHEAAQVKSVDIVAKSKAEAYDKFMYDVVMDIEPYTPYSAWVASVTYSNGNSVRFNTFEGNPY